MKKLILYTITIIMVSFLSLNSGCKKAPEAPPPAPAPAPAPAPERADGQNERRPEIPKDGDHWIIAPKAKRPSPAPATFRKLFWNIWAEDNNEPRFKPVTPVNSLKPNQSYRVAIDLAALEYGVATPSRGSFMKEVEKWLKPGMPQPTLKILLLTDKKKLEISEKAVQDFKIDVKQLRGYWQSGTDEVKDPFKILSKQYITDPQKYPKFKFGGTFFKLQTKELEGPASIAFSIWSENKPIEEVSFQVCIASSAKVEKERCGDMKHSASSQGFVSVRAASESGASPIAAIHFVSLGEDDPVTGILHVDAWAPDQFLVWQLEQKTTDFRKSISEEYLPDIASGDDDEKLLVRGEALFYYLFPREAKSDDGRKVQEEFLNFLRPYLQKDPLAKDYLPQSIFVRMIQVSPSPSLPMPLGLIAVRVDKGKEITKDNGRFLGKFFIIESPLEFQTYEPSTKCLSRWVMVLPPEDTGDAAINDARNQLGSLIEQWETKLAEPIYTSMTKFIGWLAPPSDVQTEDPSTVLVTLSHHDHNSLYFYEKEAKYDSPLRPSEINRTFAQPSIAIIDGCGTGGEGAVDLIRRFNHNGFSTIIATSVPVKGEMAGAFLQLLSKEIARSDPEKPDTIGLLYWRTINALSTSKPLGGIGSKEFGAKALRFTILGNGRVLLCAPSKEKAATITK